MRVLRGDPSGWSPPGEGAAVTVGVYDGVHLGHQRVIGELVSHADDRALVAGVVTFEVHPLTVVAPDRAPALLTTLEQKLDLFSGLGLDFTAVLPFPGRVRDMPPDEFVARVLDEGLGVRLVVVGEDFRFGRDRSGEVATLRRLGRRHGMEVEVVELLGRDGRPVSSTAIRRAVREGDVERAARALGRWFELRGEVVEGDGRGREIGIPTANLAVPGEVIVPARGIYAGFARIRAGEWPAAVSVGVRPTFGGGGEVVEAHLVGFRGDLYGQRIGLGFCRRLRDEEAYETVEELVEQIRADIDRTVQVVGGLPIRLP